MNIILPSNNNRPFTDEEKLHRGQVWQCGSVYVIPLDDETGYIFNASTKKARGYFYLLEGLDDFEITSDQLVLTDLTPELAFKKISH